ncbi:hypothetical protein BB559_000504, partial [Furculomyces boomerangus]
MEKFIQNQLEMINKEFDYELEETKLLQKNYSPKHLQKFGLALVNLRITLVKSGLGGKNIIELEAFVNSNKLPQNQFKTGDIVGIQGKSDNEKLKEDKDEKLSGIVLRSNEYKISISTENEIPSDWRDTCT